MAKKVTSREEFVAGLKEAAAEAGVKGKELADKAGKDAEEVKKAAVKAKDSAKASAKASGEKAKTHVKAAGEKAKSATEKVKKEVKNAGATVKAKAELAKDDIKKTVVVQFDGEDRVVDEVVERALKDYKSKSNKPLKDIKVYIKPEDRSAYYVVNGSYADRIDL